MVLCSRPSGKVKLSSFTSQSCKTAKKCTKIVLHVQSCCFANLNLLLLWRSRCHRGRCLGPVHTYQDIFESATFSLRIRLPSTRIWCIRHTNPQVFESALQSGNFLNTPRILKTVPSRMLSLLYFLDFSFKSYNVYAVKPSYDYCTPQLC